MIILRNISLRRGTKLLLSASEATLQPGQRIALIGANGSGKSSLLQLLLGELEPDSGEIEGLDGLSIAHMAQEVSETTLNACEYVWRGDHDVARLRDQITAADSRGDFNQSAKLHSELDAIDGYDAERRAQRLLTGLGFATDDGQQAVSTFSGGWRIRLNLARALMTRSDVLLLDEPTNHLDLDATIWLQQWLNAYHGLLVLISHDRDFIDATCERIIHLEQQKLVSYRGSYSDFERLRAERLTQQQALYEKQQRRKQDIEQFVARFRYKASKAKQAQSRLKELERLSDAAPAHADSPFDFQFLPPPAASDPLLRLDNAQLGYNKTAPVIQDAELMLREGSRIGLLGRNGAGKSTLLKTLAQELPLLSGDLHIATNCHVGYFNQQQLEALDLNASAALHLQRLRPEAREQEILNFLGGFNFKGDTATAIIAPFSGGEKARLALAMIVWQRPNLLILDEPTNHLDLDMRHALEVALQGFEGAMVLVSHDRHLLRNTVDELLLVSDGQLSLYKDNLDDYQQHILQRLQTDNGVNAPKREDNKKLQRQQQARRRAELRPLKQAVEQSERAMAKAQQTLAEIETQLTDSAIYEEANKARLTELLQEQGKLKQTLEDLEEQWFEQSTRLEEASEAI
ncbi:MAG: ABC transporter ATP-binding protein [Gammaproteobacteria bacterium]|nr:MAG: ABC transporter ATP-binding protein [Gammaproteobacteria bacterium]